MFESLKAAIKEAESESKSLEVKASNEENRIEESQAKIKLLQSDIKALEEKRDNLDLIVKEERKRQIAEIDSLNSEAHKLKSEADTERRAAIDRETAAAKIQMQAQAFKEEYEARMLEVSKQEAVLAERLIKIKEFQDSLR